MKPLLIGLLDLIAEAVLLVGKAGIGIAVALILYVVVSEIAAARGSRVVEGDDTIGRDQVREERQRQLVELQARIAAKDARRV